MDYERIVQEALNELGMDADTIAATLRAFGFRGIRGTAIDGPLAKYITTKFRSDRIVVAVTHRVIEIYTRSSPDQDMMRWKVAGRMRLPCWEVWEFIQNFEDGEYPDLEEQGLAQN